MKRYSLILFLSLGSLLSFAQVERKTVKQDSAANKAAVNDNDKLNKKDLFKELDLTREQKIKLREIRQSNKAKKDSIENNDQLSDTEKKARLRGLQKDQAQSIQLILTDEQKEKLKAKRQEARKEKN